MDFPENYYEDEVREGFYVPSLMKRNWAAGIEVLMEIDKICTKYSLQWFLCFGTLLGAVRHGGYVPWDDDLDIMMKRKDFNEFKKHKDELPEGYVIVSVKDTEDYDSIMASINNDLSAVLTPEQTVKYHGFPYNVGVDVYMLDEVSDDPQEEAERMEEIYRLLELDNELRGAEIDDRIGILERYSSKYGFKFDYEKSIAHQIIKKIDEVSSRFCGKETKYLLYMHLFMHAGKSVYESELFDKPLRIRFERAMLPVSRYYDLLLRDSYGIYDRIVKGSSMHEYPVYTKWESKIQDLGARIPYLYEFDKNDLIHTAPDRETLEERCRLRISKLYELNKLAEKAISSGESDKLSQIMALCQESAAELGEILEKSAVNSENTVRLLEEYCEAAYQIYESKEDVNVSDVLDEMDYIVSQADTELELVRERKEIVLLPFKASGWETMMPFFEKYKDDPEVSLHVVPIPYNLRGRDTSLQKEVYEGYQLKEFEAYEGVPLRELIEIEDYKTFPFEDMKPHMIVIQNPYDGYSMGSEVNRYFFSDNLKKLCDKLVYIPWFITDDIDIDDPSCAMDVANMRHYVTVPGCVSADLILLPTENLRKSYIRVLTEFCGEETKERWERCVQVM